VGAAASKHADSGTDGRDHDLEGSRVPIFPNCVLCKSKDVLFFFSSALDPRARGNKGYIMVLVTRTDEPIEVDP
jgi:hypothetical protein